MQTTHSCTFNSYVGADFIKTSTGKEGVNATLMVGLVMVRAIREYFERTGYKVSEVYCLYNTV